MAKNSVLTRVITRSRKLFVEPIIQQRVVNATSRIGNDTILSKESFSIFHDYENDGLLYLQLPNDAAVGTVIEVTIATNPLGAILVFLGRSGTKLIMNGTTYTSGGNSFAYADEEGESSKFVCITSNTWLALYVVGTWGWTQQ